MLLERGVQAINRVAGTDDELPDLKATCERGAAAVRAEEVQAGLSIGLERIAARGVVRAHLEWLAFRRGEVHGPPPALGEVRDLNVDLIGWAVQRTRQGVPHTIGERVPVRLPLSDVVARHAVEGQERRRRRRGSGRRPRATGPQQTGQDDCPFRGSFHEPAHCKNRTPSQCVQAKATSPAGRLAR